jgi:DNA-binding response OmpR family regulator
VILLAIGDPRERYAAQRALAALRPSLETTAVASRPPLLVIVDEPARIASVRSSHGDALLLALLESRTDATLALDSGADGVVIRGAPAELRARVRALLRRASGYLDVATAVGPIEIDFRARRVALGGTELMLRPLEFALLVCLASEPGRVFTKRELIRACWGERERPTRSRALESQIVRLRRRLGRHAELLVTVWSVGYVLTQPR